MGIGIGMGILGVVKNPTLSNMLIVAQAADQAGHRGGQGGAEHGHGLGRDRGQVTVISK